MKKPPSIKELRKICQPKHIDQTPLARTSRYISIYITKLFLYTPITPNQITLLGALIYMAGATLFISGSPLMIIIGGLVVRVAYLFDYVDGNVARYRGKASPEGDFLDSLVWSIPPVFLFIFLAFGIYQNFPNILVFFIGCAAVMSFLVRNFVDVAQNSILLQMILRQGLKDRKNLAWHHDTGFLSKGAASTIVARLRYPYHMVDPFIVAAVIDLVLERGFPSIMMPVSIVLVMLTIYTVFLLLDGIARVIHIVRTRHIQSLYASLSATGTTPDNTTENEEYPPKGLEDVSQHEL